MGTLIPGKTTIIEKTGGNFGFGLTVACAEVGVSVELAVGLGFSRIKRAYLEKLGAKLIGVDMLSAGKTPREVVEQYISQGTSLGKNYFYTDQFNNFGSLQAHETETGPEIVRQLQCFRDLEDITFVACAGTGASLAGISNCLRRSGYRINVVLVEPKGCDSRQGQFISHKLEGMAVGVVPPFLNWRQIDDVASVSMEEAFEMQRLFAAKSGYFIGNTSAACLHVAQLRSNGGSSKHKVLTIFYDHALWYTN